MKSHNKLLIIGAGGHGKVCADIAIKMKQWSYIGFLDDDLTKTSLLNLEIKDKLENYSKYQIDYDFFIAIGDNHLREKIYRKLIKENATIVNLIHPSANLAEDVHFKNGTVVMAGTTINSSTSIGLACIINTNASVDHDNNIGDFVHISPGVSIAGTVKIGNYSWLGIGSTINNNVEITDEALIASGSVVTKSITSSGVYAGAPVQKKKEDIK